MPIKQQLSKATGCVPSSPKALRQYLSRLMGVLDAVGVTSGGRKCKKSDLTSGRQSECGPWIRSCRNKWQDPRGTTLQGGINNPVDTLSSWQRILQPCLLGPKRPCLPKG
ncbi:uncharacterized [Tachysurus ichikawai]